MSALRSNWFIIPLLATLLPLSRLVEPPYDLPGWAARFLHDVHIGHLNDYYSRILMIVGINITMAASLQVINGLSGQFSLGHAGFMAVGAYLAGFATENYSCLPDQLDGGDRFVNPGGVLLFWLSLAGAVLLIGLLLWLLAMLVRQARRRSLILSRIIPLALIVWFLADVCIGLTRDHPGRLLIWTHGLNSLQNAFNWSIAAGTPAALKLTHMLRESWLKPACMLTLLAGAGVFAGASGLLVGLPTLRLRGDYLAIATLGFAEIIRVIINNSQAMGGATGMSVTTYHNDPDPSSALAGHYIFPWIFGVAIICVLVIWRLTHSARGRAIAAVREDEIAAAAVGINTTRQKVLAFIIGAFFAGVAGGLFTMNEGYLNPNSFGFMRSVDFVVMVTLGGLNSVWGAVIAAIVLTVLPEKLRFLNQYRMIIYSVLLIAMMQLRGGGWKRIAALFGGGPRSPRGLAVTPPDAPPHVGGGAAV